MVDVNVLIKLIFYAADESILIVF